MPPNNRRRDPRAEKLKDMAESLLPSTRRKGAREDRAAAHRKARRDTRRNPELADVYDRRRRMRINEVKWERRAGDKLSIIRWAQEVTKHIDDPTERYFYLKSVLPDTLIGRHALQHCVNWGYKDRLPILPPGEETYRYSNYEERQEAARRREESERTALRAKLQWAIETGGLKALNRAIKRAHTPAYYVETTYIHPVTGKPCNRWTTGAKAINSYFSGHRSYDRRSRRYSISPCRCVARVLKGSHDLDAFMAEVVNNQMHPEWHKAMKAHLEEDGS